MFFRRAAGACAGGLTVATTLLARCVTQNEGSTGFESHVQRRKAAAGAPVDDVDLDSAGARLSTRPDKQLVWQTLHGAHRMESVAMWRWTASRGDAAPSAASAAGPGAVVPGITRYGAVVSLGDELNGHRGLVHGGYTSALIDDLFGWCAVSERTAQGLPPDSLLFTANLSVNYRRPMPHEASYYVEVEATRLEKQKKIYMEARVYDAHDNLCADATSLYIVKLRQP
jgi:acyl-coenzyme A thioesterase PaaI-like protein